MRDAYLNFTETGVAGCIWRYAEQSGSGNTYGKADWERVDMEALVSAVKNNLYIEAYQAVAFRARPKELLAVNLEIRDDGVYLFAEFDGGFFNRITRKNAVFKRNFVDWIFDENLKAIKYRLTEIFVGALSPDVGYDAALEFLAANGWCTTHWRKGERIATLMYNNRYTIQLSVNGANIR